MTQEYDSTWDSDSDDGEAFDVKYAEWEKRDWESWLEKNLAFPFEVKREEDMEENPFDPKRGPFAVGRRIKVMGLAEEDEMGGFYIAVVSGGKRGCIPLADVEVIDKKNPNYWPVREYVVWTANH